MPLQVKPNATDKARKLLTIYRESDSIKTEDRMVRLLRLKSDRKTGELPEIISKRSSDSSFNHSDVEPSIYIGPPMFSLNH